MASFRNFSSYNRNRTNALSISELRAMVPSAFATEKHESRSQRFTYIPTSEVIEGLVAQGFEPFSAMQGNSRIEGKTEFTKHLIRFRHKSAALSALGEDVPEAVLINAHDGTSAYKIFSGMFRKVCANGLVICSETLGELSIPHKGDVVNKVIEGTFEIIGQSRRALGTVDAWKQLRLSAGEQNVFAEAAHTLRFEDSEGNNTTPITVSQLLRPRRSEDRADSDYQRAAPDLYRTMNVVQENVIRGGLSNFRRDDNGTRRVSTREVRGIDQNVRLNRALWQLAERMAELKGVRAVA
jgi:hypothetical protein